MGLGMSRTFGADLRTRVPPGAKCVAQLAEGSDILVEPFLYQICDDRVCTNLSLGAEKKKRLKYLLTSKRKVFDEHLRPFYPFIPNFKILILRSSITVKEPSLQIQQYHGYSFQQWHHIGVAGYFDIFPPLASSDEQSAAVSAMGRSPERCLLKDEGLHS